ncbi:MAG: VWA domain-containing protein [Acidobacteriota bacterium]
MKYDGPTHRRSSCTVKASAIDLGRSWTGLRSALLGVLTVVALLASAPAHGQEPDVDPLFGEVIDVRVINVEAVVTQRGDRVPGLGADDFRLLVDGDEVPIEYFAEVSMGTAITSADGPSRASGPAAVPALRPGQQVGTHYLVFIDDYFSIAARRDQVLSRMARQLKELGPEDRMAVVAYDGRKVEMLTTWTRSESDLRRVLARASDRPAYGLHRRSEWSRLRSEARSGGRPLSGSFAGTGFAGSGRGYSRGALEPGRELTGQVSRLGAAVGATMRGFAQPSGRRVMLLMSGGLPTLGEDELYYAGSLFGSERYDDQRDLRRVFGPVVETANRLGYTLYPVDMGPLDTGLTSAADRSLIQSRFRRQVESDREFLADDSLYYLADATGGRALLDGARFDALGATIRDTRSYYWIGFTPRWQGDDSGHTVELEVRRPGHKVRSRDGYADLSRRSLVTMEVESAHLFDHPLPDVEGFDVQLGPSEKAGWGKMTVPIELSIPLENVTFLPAGNGWAARLELRVVATDHLGNSAEVPVVEVDLRWDGPPGADAKATYGLTLELRRRPHRMLVSLYDPPTGTLLSQRVELAL